LNFNVNGNYLVRIDSSNGCGNVSNVFVATKVGLNELNKNDGLSVYPNPTNDELNLVIDQAGKYTVQILAMDGKSIGIGAMDGKSIGIGEPFTQQIQLKLSKLAEGLYLLTVTDEEGQRVKTVKVAVQR
jgi:hypothetical protein